MVTREDIENIAILSKLFVAEEDLDNLTQQMQEIVEFADAINNAPDSGEEFDNINNLSGYVCVSCILNGIIDIQPSIAVIYNERDTDTIAIVRFNKEKYTIFQIIIVVCRCGNTLQVELVIVKT